MERVLVLLGIPPASPYPEDTESLLNKPHPNKCASSRPLPAHNNHFFCLLVVSCCWGIIIITHFWPAFPNKLISWTAKYPEFEPLETSIFRLNLRLNSVPQSRFHLSLLISHFVGISFRGYSLISIQYSTGHFAPSILTTTLNCLIHSWHLSHTHGHTKPKTLSETGTFCYAVPSVSPYWGTIVRALNILARSHNSEQHRQVNTGAWTH